MMRVAPALTVVALMLACQGTAWAEKRVQARTPPALCDAERARLRETALVIGPTGEPPLVPYRDRSDADRDLRRLSRIAEGPGGCAAALTNRGIIQWSLSRTGWTPKDAPGQAAGRPWRTEAVLSFSEAARVSDEGAVVGAILGATAVLQLEGVMPELATRLGPVLFARLRYPGFIADTTRHLVRGRLAVWLGLPLAADSAFVAYAGAGGDPGLAALELARIRLATGRGDSAYWMAVASRNPEVIDGLAYDLDFIADSAERAELDALGRTQRLAWFENFWRSRDLESLHPAGSRLAEHYARLAHARRHFRLMRYPRAYETFELWRNPDAEFDDRGLIYVRHGPPDDSASMAFAACPNLSWLYREPAGNMVFHFIARDDPDDWRLIETLANAEGGNGATTRLRRNFDFVGCQPEPGLLWSRAAIDPVYARLAVYPNRRDWERELGMITRSREIGTTTDSHEYRFADPMTASLQAYGLLSSRGQGQLLLVTTARSSAADPGPAENAGIRIAQRVVARAGDRIVELDSMRRFRRPPGEDRVITFLTELGLGPGNWTIGMVVSENDSTGQLFRDSVEVPGVSPGTVALSDILLGGPGGPAWQAPDGIFRLDPFGRFEAGEEIPLYYQLAGLDPGGRVTTEIAFEREGNRVQLTFEDLAAGGTQSIRRFLGTAGLEPGRYRLSIRASANGSTATRSTEVFIVRRKGDQE